MKSVKLITTITLILIIMVVMAACSNKEDIEVVTEESVETIEEGLVEPEESGIDELDAMGDVEIDKGLFNVEMTIPAEFVGEEATQENLDQEAMKNGYKSIILNEDGSATYTMTKTQHNKMMDEMKTSFDISFQEMVASEDYPNVVSIKANDNYTEFIVVTKNQELDMSESFSVLTFYMYSGMYNIFNGTEVDNINIKYINEASGEIISESNSSDMYE